MKEPATATVLPTPIGIISDDESYVNNLLRTLTREERSRVVVEALTGGLTSQLQEQARALFVVVSAETLPEVAGVVREAVRQHHLEGLFVRDDAPEWIPQLLDRAGLRTLRNTLVHDRAEIAVPRRVLTAHVLGAEDDLIADARLLDDRLLVLTCALETIEVPFVAIKPLAALPEGVRARFVISEDGSYISWPDAELDLDLDAFRYAVNPQYRERVDRVRRAYGARYGRAMRSFREERGLRQREIAALSERQVRRIEKEGTTSSGALRALADAHGMALQEYLDEIAKRAK